MRNGDIILNPNVSEVEKGSLTHKPVINPEYLLFFFDGHLYDYEGYALDLTCEKYRYAKDWKVVGHIKFDFHNVIKNSIINVFKTLPKEELNIDKIVDNTRIEIKEYDEFKKREEERYYRTFSGTPKARHTYSEMDDDIDSWVAHDFGN